MTFAYAAGSTTPDYSGLFEIPAKTLRICNVGTGSPLVDPTFHPLLIPPIVSTAPIRYNVTSIPRGSNVSDPLFDAWQFDVTGWFLMDDVNDVGAAFSYLADRISVASGWMGATFNDPSWAEARTMTIRKAGPVAYGTNPDKGEMAAGYREFVLPFIAEDPLKYGTTLASTAITTSTAVTNGGNAAVPFIVRFDGANTDHIQIDSGAADGTILLNYALASGKYAEINTRDGSYTTNVSADLSPFIAVGSGARLLSPGSNFFTKSSGGGGTATVKHYDGFE